jgi:hypothetical protein
VAGKSNVHLNGHDCHLLIDRIKSVEGFIVQELGKLRAKGEISDGAVMNTTKV